MAARDKINLDEYDEKGRKIHKKRDMSDFQVLKRVIGFLNERQFRPYLVGFFVAMILGSLLGFVTPYLFGKLVDEGLGGGVAGASFNQDAFYHWGLLIFVTIFPNFILWIAQQYIIFYLANSVMHRMRKKLFSNLQRLSFDYYDDANRSSGKIISYMTNDVETIHNLISSGLLNIFANIFNLVGALILMFLTSVELSIVSFLVISCVVLIGIPFLLKARQYFVIMRRTVANVTGNLQESISGSRLIKAFAYEEKDWNKFKGNITDELKINLKVQKLFSAMPGVIMSLLGGGLGIILLVSARLIDSGGVEGIGEIFQFVLYMIQFFGPIVGIVMFVNEIQNSMTAGERIIKLVDLKPSITNKADHIELTEKGQILFDCLFGNKKIKKRYGNDKINEMKDISKSLGPESFELIRLVGISTNLMRKHQNKVKLAENFVIPKPQLLAFLKNNSKYFEPYKESQLNKIRLSNEGHWVLASFGSKKKAIKRFGEENIDSVMDYSKSLDKFSKKIFKIVGSGSALALRSPKTTEVVSLMEQMELPKNKILEIYRRNFDYLIREMPIEIQNLKGHIEFKNVKFSYVPNVPIIKNLSMEIQPGERVAIVGYTGAGKSTIINLLGRFYDIDEGSISIDGHDLRDINIQTLRQKMGTVLQENYLFSGSVMENIRYGRQDATDEEIMAAAKKVGAHEFIINLPKGYDTEVEERGNLLSIGQKQLIAFTRALIRDPPILILDEATSAVDPYSELIIQEALEVLLKNRTSISIAHRLSTIINSDRIFCLKDGEIVESGSHAELMQIPDGLYHQLFTLQYRDAYKTDVASKST